MVTETGTTQGGFGQRVDYPTMVTIQTPVAHPAVVSVDVVGLPQVIPTTRSRPTVEIPFCPGPG